jgi:hypothetical protein
VICNAGVRTINSVPFAKAGIGASAARSTKANPCAESTATTRPTIRRGLGSRASALNVAGDVEEAAFGDGAWWQLAVNIIATLNNGPMIAAVRNGKDALVGCGSERPCARAGP